MNRASWGLKAGTRSYQAKVLLAIVLALLLAALPVDFANAGRLRWLGEIPGGT